MVLRKDQLETKLKDDNQLIQSGVLRNEHPLDLSDNFNQFLVACRRGDLRRCQELINSGVNLNGKDQFDYTPLIIVSLRSAVGEGEVAIVWDLLNFLSICLTNTHIYVHTDWCTPIYVYIITYLYLICRLLHLCIFAFKMHPILRLTPLLL